MENHVEIFKRIAYAAIADLAKLPQPVVRLCGPFTTGGFGYEENTRRFAAAESVLRKRGLTVFSYEKYEEDIYRIYNSSMHNDVMEYFHKPILESGYIKTAYFLPRWMESKGATYEHDLISRLGIEIEDFKEEWF